MHVGFTDLSGNIACNRYTTPPMPTMTSLCARALISLHATLYARLDCVSPWSVCVTSQPTVSSVRELVSARKQPLFEFAGICGLDCAATVTKLCIHSFGQRDAALIAVRITANGADSCQFVASSVQALPKGSQRKTLW